ncbi:unnamed protein product, partial [Ectocarpus sp. 12 AP-2014]
RLYESLFFRVGGEEVVVPFNERVIEIFSHARLRHQDGARTNTARGSSVPPVSGGGGGSGASPYYPRAAVAAAATAAAAGLDPWGIGGGLKGA